MASEDPYVSELQKLAEKQMKSTLHAKFLENCRSDGVIPKGLQLKLQVSVGKDSDSENLQKSVNVLLDRVSLEICDRVRDFHLRRSHELSRLLESKRDELKTRKSPNDLLIIDSSIKRQTDEKKEVLQAKHEKKLNSLRNQSELIPVTETDHLERNPQQTRDTTAPWIEVRQKRTRNCKQNIKTGKYMQPAKQPVKDRAKTKPQTKSAKQPVTNRTKTKPPTRPAKQPEKGPSRNSPSAQAENLEDPTDSKNVTAPSTRISYLEAAKNGAMRQTPVTSLQESLEKLTRLVSDLITATKQKDGDAKDASYDAPTRGRGEQQRRDYGRYRKEKSQF